jgi:hypothetical protein
MYLTFLVANGVATKIFLVANGAAIEVISIASRVQPSLF